MAELIKLRLQSCVHLNSSGLCLSICSLRASLPVDYPIHTSCTWYQYVMGSKYIHCPYLLCVRLDWSLIPTRVCWSYIGPSSLRKWKPIYSGSEIVEKVCKMVNLRTCCSQRLVSLQKVAVTWFIPRAQKCSGQGTANWFKGDITYLVITLDTLCYDSGTRIFSPPARKIGRFHHVIPTASWRPDPDLSIKR